MDIVDRLLQGRCDPGPTSDPHECELPADECPCAIRADAAAEITRLRKRVAAFEDGNRPLPFNRDELGRMVREAWVRWAQTQPNPKPSWLAPYDELSEPDKEADRQIGEAIARWTLIGDAGRWHGAEQAVWECEMSKEANNGHR